MFIVISIFSLPMMSIYSSGNALENSRFYFINQFTLGNLGGSSIFCNQVDRTDGKMAISCPVGSTLETKHALFGLIMLSFKINTLAHRWILINCTGKSLWITIAHSILTTRRLEINSKTNVMGSKDVYSSLKAYWVALKVTQRNSQKMRSVDMTQIYSSKCRVW